MTAQSKEWEKPKTGGFTEFVQSTQLPLGFIRALVSDESPSFLLGRNLVLKCRPHVWGWTACEFLPSPLCFGVGPYLSCFSVANGGSASIEMAPPAPPVSLEYGPHVTTAIVPVCRVLCGFLLTREVSWIKPPPWLDPSHSKIERSYIPRHAQWLSYFPVSTLPSPTLYLFPTGLRALQLSSLECLFQYLTIL